MATSLLGREASGKVIKLGKDVSKVKEGMKLC